MQHLRRIPKLGELLPAANAMFVIPIIPSLAKHGPDKAETLQTLEIIEPPIPRICHLGFIIPHAGKYISGEATC
ncbi:MAG TPA: hypothetical protein VHZ25_00015, partial [Acidobacteriaceae bacterium]|nr:hypothetical protein [Acidobacteriaceae bacterium]